MKTMMIDLENHLADYNTSYHGKTGMISVLLCPGHAQVIFPVKMYKAVTETIANIASVNIAIIEGGRGFDEHPEVEMFFTGKDNKCLRVHLSGTNTTSTLNTVDNEKCVLRLCVGDRVLKTGVCMVFCQKGVEKLQSAEKATFVDETLGISGYGRKQ